MKNNDLYDFSGNGFISLRLLSSVNRFFAAVLTLGLCVVSLHRSAMAQTYPHWNTAGPGVYEGNAAAATPFVASPQALYAVASAPNGTAIVARWTECDNWSNSVIDDDNNFFITNGPVGMTLHSNYLYVVGGVLQVGGTNTSIARFNLNTGTWAALSDSFPAVSLLSLSNGVTSGPFPSTIAVDSSNRIYVGFDARFTNASLETEVVDILDVSTNDGASWQTVGNGMLTSGSLTSGSYWYEPQVTALHADGTNLYVGGEFSGGDGVASQGVIMWDGNNWHALNGGDGVGPLTGGHGAYAANLPNTVNAIVSIGTNIYVSGAFTSPQEGLARFSNVTGGSLETGDPVEYVFQPDSFEWGGVGLAVNQGNLYFGIANGANDTLAVLSNPTADTISSNDWAVIGGTTDTQVLGINSLIAASNGDCVFVDGDFSGTNQLYQLVTASESSRTSAITDDVWDSGTHTSTLSFSGTPGSTCDLYYSPDLTNWTWIETTTLWGGTNGYADSSSPTPLYYQLSNTCNVSVPFQVDIQFGETDVMTNKSGPAAIGNTYDYWNPCTLSDSPPAPNDSGLVEQWSCKDIFQNSTEITVGIYELSGDEPSGSAEDISTDPLLNGSFLPPAGGTMGVQIGGLASGSYDIYLYATGPEGGSPLQRDNSTFMIESGASNASDWPDGLTTSSGTTWSENTYVEGNQYVVFSGVEIASGTPIMFSISNTAFDEPVINGIQVVPHGSW
jgi:hypothetical protein